MPFNCVIVGQGPQFVACAQHWLSQGHRIHAVVSNCPQVSAWSQKEGVTRIDPKEDQVALLSREPFDFLFSIVNHSIMPAGMLVLPRLGAINYHDSALPSYSGFNATSWAILDGNKEHGITWHRMTAQVDAGAVLLQKIFPIAEEDTAFSLAARASDMAVKSFAELVDGLEKGAITESPAQAARDFHYKSDRPGFAALDWTQTGSTLLQLVRAMDFGTEDSWMTRAKLELPNGDFLCVGSGSMGSGTDGVPGKILSVTRDGFEVSVKGGGIVLSDLSTIDGDVLSGEDFSRLGLIAGAVLPLRRVDFVEAAVNLDREVSKVERAWVRRLENLSVPAIHELKVHAAKGALDRVAVPLPASFGLLQEKEQRACLVASLSTYLYLVGNDEQSVDLGLFFNVLPRDLRSLYSTVVPISIDVPKQVSWSEMVTRVQDEVEGAIKRKTFARDIWTRYSGLKKKTPAERQLPIALSFTDVTEDALPSGVCLLVTCAIGSKELVLTFDSAAMGGVHAQRLGLRLVQLLENALKAPDSPLCSLPVVTSDERDRLLGDFQDTLRPNVVVSCIHDLFSAQVARSPQKTAIVFRDDSLTYQELEDRANALASRLQKLGVGPEKMVAISIERSLDMVVGLLAILKAGGAYVPLDPAYPGERLAMMLEDSGAKWLLTQKHLVNQLPGHGAQVILVDTPDGPSGATVAPTTTTTPENLAYVIFTSGSTGRPKGVMVEHRNVANFFAGMDERVGPEPGVWLAVTSISFDISVLEIFWTLTRGFEVVIQEEGDRASLLKTQSTVRASNRPMGFGLFYFAADSTGAPSTNAYRLLLEGSRFADTHDFTAVWTPERHFHAFGGLYPNAAVTSAAIASITSNVQLRAGSVVIPLHDPIRVAEDWAVVDNISGGRVGLSFASGWHANDFALKPENYERRREVMQESIDTVLRLWAGEKIKVKNGLGEEIEVGVLPRPVRERPPMWIASAGNIETFRAAGRSGYNVLTNMLGQDMKDLGGKFAAYREARRECGHQGDGIISVMLHTFVTDDDEKARKLARGPFGNYLTTSYDLVKVAPWMFPAFKQPSIADSGTSAFDPSRFDASDMEALLDHAFDRYFDTAGLFGTPERALGLIEQLKDIGATEVACLIDFGIDPQVVLDNLVHLDALRRLSNPGDSVVNAPATPVSIREQFERRKITHFQCTPSMTRMLVADGTIPEMRSLRKFLMGGEALPVDLAEDLMVKLPDIQLLNMYGPTETTVWSTSALIGKSGEPICIGKPIANTQIRILNSELTLAPIGTAGELCIGGAGVVRGYLHRPDLTDEKFIADPYSSANRLYKTGDLARFREDGAIEYIGRIDQQVKVNGYRIELGEIETILAKHPAVTETVVAVKDGSSGPELVGYVIAAGGASQQSDQTSEVIDWKERWDEAYSKRSGATDAPARFNTSGWLNSYTGDPIPGDQMREWLDQTVQRILDLAPKKILEIGCGTGMILYSCLPHVDQYTAVDLSPFALETIRGELNPQERSKVTLFNHAAHELDSIGDKSCDLVIINSVAQYFPNAEYLVQVLQQASRVLVDGGKVFLGDVRSLEEERAFHTLVELQKAPGQMQAALLKDRIADRAAMETELLLSSGFFGELESRVPQLAMLSIDLKHGQFATEMRDFRSDVVMQVRQADVKLNMNEVRTLDKPAGVDSILAVLAEQPKTLLVTGMKNARLDRIHAVSSSIQSAERDLTVEMLRQMLDDQHHGIEPNAIFDLSAEYQAELRFGKTPGTFDALLRKRGATSKLSWPVLPLAANPAPLASSPRTRIDFDSLVPKLKLHLRDFLPEYMVPQSFVAMDVFPLTPNGKIDRKALPRPAEVVRKSAIEYVVPGNELERTIADIWREMLGVERVGRKDNIFDLGASSLLTVEANNRLQNALGRKIPLVTMFRYPTIETLASHLAKAMAPEGTNGAAATSAVEDERQSRLAAAAERRRRARAQV